MAPSTDRLFSTDNGSSLRCACCGRIEVTFRGVPFLLTDDDLPVLQSILRSVTHGNHAPDDVWELKAKTSKGLVTVHYRFGDLVELSDLIHGTCAMLELNQILQDLSVGSTC